MKPTIKKIRRGLYRIVGITCGRCGGDLQIERENADGEPVSRDPGYRWETFCVKCRCCDCNGWPTLADALANAEEYFCQTKGAKS